jgi:hypothetical protein
MGGFIFANTGTCGNQGRGFELGNFLGIGNRRIDFQR